VLLLLINDDANFAVLAKNVNSFFNFFFNFFHGNADKYNAHAHALARIIAFLEKINKKSKM